MQHLTGREWRYLLWILDEPRKGWVTLADAIAKARILAQMSRVTSV